jgi:hypothetical protein
MNIERFVSDLDEMLFQGNTMHPYGVKTGNFFQLGATNNTPLTG